MKSAPYINSLLTHSQTSYAKAYYNPTNSANQIWGQDHLVEPLGVKGVSWKTCQENITGTTCPLSSSGKYGAKHNPFIFFDDVTNGLQANSSFCIAHVRPFGELTSDLANNTVARSTG